MNERAAPPGEPKRASAARDFLWLVVGAAGK